MKEKYSALQEWLNDRIIWSCWERRMDKVLPKELIVRLKGKGQLRAGKSKNWSKGDGDLSVPVQPGTSVSPWDPKHLGGLGTERSGVCTFYGKIPLHETTPPPQSQLSYQGSRSLDWKHKTTVFSFPSSSNLLSQCHPFAAPQWKHRFQSFFLPLNPKSYLNHKKDPFQSSNWNCKVRSG